MAEQTTLSTNDIRVGFSTHKFCVEVLQRKQRLMPHRYGAHSALLPDGRRRITLTPTDARAPTWGTHTYAAPDGNLFVKATFRTEHVRGDLGTPYTYTVPLSVRLDPDGTLNLLLASGLRPPAQHAHRAAPPPDPFADLPASLLPSTAEQWSAPAAVYIQGGAIPPDTVLRNRFPCPQPGPAELVQLLNAHVQATGDKLALAPDGRLRLWMTVEGTL